ncbi:MAG: nitroreductase family protein [Kiritimatiellia bacterium]|jgi:nitroreductase
MDIMDIIARRTSCRSYRPDPVPKEQLDELVEAVRLAPSACNRQPWRLAVVQDAGLRERIVKEGFLPGISMSWAKVAPVLVVLGMQRSLVAHRLGASLSGVDYPWLDLGIAGEHLVLAATGRGLGTCWIGWIKPPAIARIVGWPKTLAPAAVIAVGYPANPMPDTGAAPNRKSAEEIATWM